MTKSNLTLLGILFLSILTPTLTSQQLLITKEWETDAGVQYFFRKSKTVTDGSFNVYVIGETITGFGTYDWLVEKYDRDGILLWSNQYDGGVNQNDVAVDVLVDNSGNVFVAGTSTRVLGDSLDLCLIKYNSSGISQWIQHYNGSADGNDVAASIIQDVSGNTYLTGTSKEIGTGHDFVLLKYSSSGVQQWVSFFDSDSLNDTGIKMIFKGSTPNVVVTGVCQTDSATWELTTIGFSSVTGVIQNVHQTTSLTGAFHEVMDITADTSGNIFITGSYKSTPTSDWDVKTMKLNSSLTVLWSVLFGNNGSGMHDRGNALTTDTVGNIYVTGYVTTLNGGKDLILLKYNSSGTLLFDQTYTSGFPNADDSGQDILINLDNNPILTGYRTNASFNKDYVTLGYNSSGQILWQTINSSATGLDDIATDLALDSNQNIIVTGQTQISPSLYSYKTVKYKFMSRSLAADSSDTNGVRWLANEAILEFNPNIVDTSFVNDPEKSFILLADLIPDSVLNFMNSKTGLDFYKIPVLKIFTSMRTSDTISISRTGDTITIPRFWSIFVALLPNGTNVPVLCDSLMRLQQPFLIHTAEPNIVSQLLIGTDDYYYNNTTDPNDDPNGNVYGQYSLHDLDGSYPDAHIDIEPAWDVETGNEYIKVGIFDSGIAWKHPDFRFVEPYDYTNVVVKGGKIYTVVGYPGYENFQDGHTSPHGTSVAGIIGAVRNNGSVIPTHHNIAGIAGGNYLGGQRGVSLYTMQTSGLIVGQIGSSGADPKLLAMYDGASSDIYGLHIANHSWAGTTSTFLRLLNYAWRNGMVNVAARGQTPIMSSVTQIAYPACYDDDYILNVGGSGTDGRRYHPLNGGGLGGESCYGSGVDLIAPGVCALNYSTSTNDGMGCFGGTSASAPHAAGVAALLMSQQNPTCINSPPNLAPEDVEFLLQYYAEDVSEDITGGTGLPLYDIYSGWGLLDAGNTLAHLDYPRYQVYHSQDATPSVGSVLSNQTITLNNNTTVNFPNIPIYMYGLPPGTYTADRYEYNFSFHDVFPNTTQILNYWPVPSSTYGVDGNSPVGHFDGYASYNFAPDPNGHELSVTATTYLWHITSGPNGSMNEWIPVKPESVNAAYSVHIYDNTNTTTENVISSTVSVFPSPMEDWVHIQFSCPISSNVSIRIFDIQGRNILTRIEQPYSPGIYTLPVDVSSFRSGVYLCEIWINNERYVEKLVKH